MLTLERPLDRSAQNQAPRAQTHANGHAPRSGDDIVSGTHILIADDHDLVREALASVLAHKEGVEVHQADSLEAAFNVLKQPIPFDLILLDYDMPGMDGLYGFERMLAHAKETPVALMTGCAPADIAPKIIDKGGAGFIPKTLSTRALLAAVDFMIAGEVYAPHQTMRNTQPQNDGLLSERERQVLAGLCEGYSNKEIARDLALSEVTIKLHVKTLTRKLHARNRTHAAIIARDRRLI